MTEPINHELKRLRRISGLSQDDVARILGVGGRSYISLLESGDRIPHVRDTVLLSMLFGTESKTLFPHLYVITKDQFVSNLSTALEFALNESEPDKERISYMRDALTEAQLSGSTENV